MGDIVNDGSKGVNEKVSSIRRDGPLALTFRTELIYSLLNFCSRPVRYDTNFGLQDTHVECKKNGAGDFVFCSYAVSLHGAGLAEGETHP